MPAFDFKCTNCDHAGEYWLRKYDEILNCSKCNHVMNKQASAPNLGGMDSIGRSK